MKINRQYVISVYSLFALIAISLHIAMSDSALAHDELKSECSVWHEFEVLREQFLEKVEGVEKVKGWEPRAVSFAMVAQEARGRGRQHPSDE